MAKIGRQDLWLDPKIMILQATGIILPNLYITSDSLPLRLKYLQFEFS
jgi:hypothetical protein